MVNKFSRRGDGFSNEKREGEERPGLDDDENDGGSQVRPSNASTYSSQSSTASTVQSSLFSREAPTATTMSTMESRQSKLANIMEQAEEHQPAAGDATASTSGASSASQAGGKRMKVIDFGDMTEFNNGLVSESTAAVSTPPISQRGPGSSQQRNYLAALDPYIYNSKSSDIYSTARSTRSPQPSYSFQQPVTVETELQKLADDLESILGQVKNRTMEVTRAGSAINNMLKNTARSPVMSGIEQGQVTLHTHPVLSRILKVTLHFVDNLLQHHQATKMSVLQSLYEVGVKLQLVEETPHSVPYPVNFAVGAIAELPGQQMLDTLISRMATKADTPLAEQEGAFIAPVLRGVTPEFSVLSLSFGFPDLQPEHHTLVENLYGVAPDLHIYCQKNYIRACAGKRQGRLKPPFRVPADANAPPIGMSLSSSTAVYQSGTLGGYVYPKVKQGHPLYEAYGKSTFAMTCGHVVLMDGGQTYPEISVPSSVLISYYRKTLQKEREKYPPLSEERATYQNEITQLDTLYPVSGPQQTNKAEQAFGKIAWGERKVVNGAMSDVALIKCSPDLKCRNFLGDDVEFSEHDPALMFGNLHVKRIVRKVHPGLKVFKYGSTSKYTHGRINGPRIVYWADGRLQTSEFVVGHPDSSLFASGGDSGSWVLQKSEDSVDQNNQAAQPTLGVVGMLHSYDGEKREFGLISTIDAILDRLYQVTNVQWGVVGVPEQEFDDAFSPAGGSDSSQSDSGSIDGE